MQFPGTPRSDVATTSIQPKDYEVRVLFVGPVVEVIPLENLPGRADVWLRNDVAGHRFCVEGDCGLKLGTMVSVFEHRICGGPWKVAFRDPRIGRSEDQVRDDHGT